MRRSHRPSFVSRPTRALPVALLLLGCAPAPPDRDVDSAAPAPTPAPTPAPEAPPAALRALARLHAGRGPAPPRGASFPDAPLPPTLVRLPSYACPPGRAPPPRLRAGHARPRRRLRRAGAHASAHASARSGARRGERA